MECNRLFALLPCYHTDPFASLARSLFCIILVGSHKAKPGFFQQLSYLFQGVRPLEMGFLIFVVELFLICLLDKECQLILIHVLFFIIIVIPDKAGIFPVFRDRPVAQHLPVFIFRIKIKRT